MGYKFLALTVHSLLTPLPLLPHFLPPLFRFVVVLTYHLRRWPNLLQIFRMYTNTQSQSDYTEGTYFWPLYTDHQY